MDPLSLTVSVLTLTGVAINTIKGLEKLRQALGTQDKLLELLNEVADFRALLSIVNDLVITHDNDTAPAKAILHILERAQVLLLELDQITAQILKSPEELRPPPSKNGTPLKVSRRAWLLHEGKLLRVRESLRDVRSRLNIGISVFTSGRLPQISLHLHSLSSITSTIAAQQRTMHDRMDQQDVILGNVQSFFEKLATSEALMVSSSSSSIETRPQIAEPLNLGGKESRLLSRSSMASPLHTTPRADGICFKTSVRGLRQCSKSCPCRCHSTSHMKAPLWMNNLLGLLFMGYSGVPRLNVVTCNQRQCKGSEDSNLIISYYFPPWLASRMINVIVKRHSQDRPSMSLRVLRVLPDDSPLFAYVRQGDITSIQSLFQQRLASPIDIAASDGRSALHIAIYAGRPKVARFLIDQDADLEYEDKYFNSAIGACWEMTFQKVPALAPCTVGGSMEETDFLDNREFTMLHRIVLGLTSIPLGEHLRHSNSSIDVQDVSGRTALHWASARGDVETIKTLFEFGANPNILSVASWAPLHHTAQSEIPETLELLLMNGAKVDEPNNRGDTTLSIAALVHDDTRFLEPLYSFGADLHSTNQKGETSLHRAACRDNVRTAKWLIERGVDRDQVDKIGYTAMHQCIRSASHNTLTFLLDAGCQTDMRANNGRTILHDAAAHGDLETLTILSAASLDSIDIEIKDSQGMNAQDIFNSHRYKHLDEEETQRLSSMRLFESLLQKLKCDGMSPACNSVPLNSELTDELDKFFDAAEKMESSFGSASLQAWMSCSESLEMPGALQ